MAIRIRYVYTRKTLQHRIVTRNSNLFFPENVICDGATRNYNRARFSHKVSGPFETALGPRGGHGP